MFCPVQVITADAKGVVLHERDLKEQTRKAAQNRKQKMEKRLSRGEKKRTPEDVIAEAFEEASHRDPNHEKDWLGRSGRRQQHPDTYSALHNPRQRHQPDDHRRHHPRY
jgi:hypothetical protein